MEKLTFTRTYLSNVKVIMAILHVPLVELLCLEATRQILALGYLLPGARG
jgi:hypothetical protein